MAKFVRYGVRPLIAHEEIDDDTFERVRGSEHFTEGDQVYTHGEDSGGSIEGFYKDGCSIIFDRTHMDPKRNYAEVGPRSITISSESLPEINSLAVKLGLPEVLDDTKTKTLSVAE